jgi:multisubunit Na+/H+ antiporter MnhE subunit
MSEGKQGNHPRVSGGRRRRPPWIVRWLAAWILLLVLWMLMASTLDPMELLAGALGAAIAATAVEVVRRQRIAPLRPRPSWLLRGWSLPIRVFAEFGVVLAALWRKVVLRRPVHGVFRAVPFEVGGRDSRSIARRAAVTMAASLAPNRYIIDFDSREGRVLVHELVARREDIVP